MLIPSAAGSSRGETESIKAWESCSWHHPVQQKAQLRSRLQADNTPAKQPSQPVVRRSRHRSASGPPLHQPSASAESGHRGPFCAPYHWSSGPAPTGDCGSAARATNRLWVAVVKQAFDGVSPALKPPDQACNRRNRFHSFTGEPRVDRRATGSTGKQARCEAEGRAPSSRLEANAVAVAAGKLQKTGSSRCQAAGARGQACSCAYHRPVHRDIDA